MNATDDEARPTMREMAHSTQDEIASDSSFPTAVPISSPLVFMRPRFLRPHPALAYLPFLFWLIDVMRPHVAVQLGLGTGTDYFGVCQALDRLGEGAICLGVALPQEGEDETTGLPPDLAEYNTEHYREFSTLIQEDARSAAARAPDGIDLLIVDGAAGEVGSAVAEDWLPRLSNRAVIVMRGVTVDAYAREVGPDRIAISMGEEEGLRAVLFGPVQDDRLHRMAALAPGTPGHSQAWQIFRRLGHALVAEAEAGRRDVALAEARNLLKAAEQRAANAEARMSASMAAWSERHERAAELEAKLFDLQSRPSLSEHADGGAAAGLTARVADLENEISALRASEALRFEELAILARMIEERDAHAAQHQRLAASKVRATGVDAQALKSKIATRDARIRALSAQVAAVTKRLEDAVRDRDALLASTSWKLTGPVRRVSMLVRKRS